MEFPITPEHSRTKDFIVDRIIELSEQAFEAESEMNRLCPLLDKYGTTIEAEIELRRQNGR